MSELNLESVKEQMAKVFRCPTAVAQGVSTFNIPDDKLNQLKAEQKEHKAVGLRVQA